MIAQSGLLDVLAITTPVFIIIGIGFIAVRIAIVPDSSPKILAAFLVNFAAPALLFKSISTRQFTEIIEPKFLLAYGIGSLIAFLSVYFAAKLILKRESTLGAILGMGGSFSNSLMLGFPIVHTMMGAAALIPFAQVLLVENLLMMPLTLALADAGRRNGQNGFIALLKLLPSVLTHPLVLAILLGMLFSWFQLTLPAPVNKVIDLLSVTVPGVGLFAIGGMLVGFKHGGNIKNLLLVISSKLVLHPLIVFLVFYLFIEVSTELQLAGVMFAAMPMFALYAVIGERYGNGPLSAASLVLATLCSFVSITLVIWLMLPGNV